MANYVSFRRATRARFAVCDPVRLNRYLIRGTYQGWVEGRALHSYAGVRVLVGWWVRSAVHPNAPGVLKGGQTRRIVLAGTHALARHRVRDQRPPRLATLRRPAARGAPRRQSSRHAGRAPRTQRTATWRRRRPRISRRLPHQQLQQPNKEKKSNQQSNKQITKTTSREICLPTRSRR